MMLSRRTDYDPAARALLLRKENQKQNKDQRIALPPRAAVAVERLLEAHGHDRIFGVWPFDPPEKSTGRRKWRVLSKRFKQLLVGPAGLTLPKGVATRQFRRTAATIVEENGGNAQELLGRRGPKDHRTVQGPQATSHLPPVASDPRRSASPKNTFLAISKPGR